MNAGFSRRKALLFNALSAPWVVVVVCVGYLLIGSFEQGLLPLLVLTSSSFIYVSVADPLATVLQQRHSARETPAQGGGPVGSGPERRRPAAAAAAWRH